MTLPTASAAIAMNRFGLGACAGQPAPASPREWLTTQLERFEPRPPVIAAAPSSGAMAAQFRDYLMQVRAFKASVTVPPSTTPLIAAATPAPDTSGEKTLRQTLRAGYRASYGALVNARITAALTSPAPFAERLTHFWANHFAVSADAMKTIGLAGTLEFEAIRPNLFGRFADLMLAVERHPAMLLYLDQAQSIGPNSMVGSRAALRLNARRKVGLNENLAREILELHTLGVGSGYTQADVLELARAMTGWSVGGFVRQPIGVEAPDGAFIYQPTWHEPGTRTLLGRRYPDSGPNQARAMFGDLAVHPATATHIATKLVRHFVADVPPPALVAKLARVHVESGGDLSAVYAALVAAPQAWAEPLAKFKSPWDWQVSALRALGIQEAVDLKLAGALGELGQPVWRPGSPAGWDDVGASWAAPDALLRRVEVARAMTAKIGDRLDARTLGPQVLPGVWSAASAAAVARAASPAQALALLLVAPEFMRR